MMDDKTNVETFKAKCFYLITRKNGTKTHDESLSFDYPIYIFVSSLNLFVNQMKVKHFFFMMSYS